jgi:hypothetical protein
MPSCRQRLPASRKAGRFDRGRRARHVLCQPYGPHFIRGGRYGTLLQATGRRKMAPGVDGIPPPPPGLADNAQPEGQRAKPVAKRLPNRLGAISATAPGIRHNLLILLGIVNRTCVANCERVANCDAPTCRLAKGRQAFRSWTFRRRKTNRSATGSIPNGVLQADAIL